MEKDIVWFDLETTGVNTSSDRIIEICMIKTDAQGNEIGVYHKLVHPGSEIEMRQEAVDKHGITYEMLEGKDTFDMIAKEVFDFIGDSNLGGYNALYFDVPMLVEEFMRCGIAFSHRQRAVIDPFLIYSKYERRDLSSAYKKYTGKELEGAHRADEVVNESRKSQVDLSGKYKIAEIDGKKEIVFNFGKNKGRTFKEVYEADSRYIEWMIDKGEFSKEVKIISRKLLEKMRAENITL